MPVDVLIDPYEHKVTISLFTMRVEVDFIVFHNTRGIALCIEETWQWFVSLRHNIA